MIGSTLTRLAAATLASLLFLAIAPAGQADSPPIKSVDIGRGISLHYVDVGKGEPIVFVHGSISDGGYWSGQLDHYATRYRAIAYSRRYNFPNHNAPRAGYSAVVDAEDLAAFIQRLRLNKVDIVGHSYGALTALFLASKHPELVNKLVLCEPPVVSLLEHIEGPEAAAGRGMFSGIQYHMVGPMKDDFKAGRSEDGVRTFVDFVLRDPNAWDHMSASAHEQTMRDVGEWNVMMTTGELFPEISPEAIRSIMAPTLIVSGAQSYPFLGVIDRELARLMPNSHSVVIAGAGHQMWYQQQEATRTAVDSFLRDGRAKTTNRTR